MGVYCADLVNWKILYIFGYNLKTIFMAHVKFGVIKSLVIKELEKQIDLMNDLDETDLLDFIDEDCNLQVLINFFKYHKTSSDFGFFDKVVTDIPLMEQELEYREEMHIV